MSGIFRLKNDWIWLTKHLPINQQIDYLPNHYSSIHNIQSILNQILHFPRYPLFLYLLCSHSLSQMPSIITHVLLNLTKSTTCVKCKTIYAFPPILNIFCSCCCRWEEEGSLKCGSQVLICGSRHIFIHHHAHATVILPECNWIKEIYFNSTILFSLIGKNKQVWWDRKCLVFVNLTHPLTHAVTSSKLKKQISSQRPWCYAIERQVLWEIDVCCTRHFSTLVF